MRAESHCQRLSDELRAGSWRPSEYRVFEIREPKIRTICAAPFCDRVVHQALVQVIEPAFERGFIADSYSCRIGKGTHAALSRVERWAHQYPWVLKLDVEKYFPSVDHKIALQLVKRRVSCGRTLSMLSLILASWSSREAPLRWFEGDDLFDPAVRGRGLPIGNLTSQFLSNIVLDPVDHSVKDRLRIRPYARYCDDIVVFSRSVEELHAVHSEMKNALSSLRLVESARKTHIFQTSQGVPWVGFNVHPSVTVLRQASVRRARRRFRAFARRPASDATRASVAAWRGHAARGLSVLGVREFLRMAGVATAVTCASPPDSNHRAHLAACWLWGRRRVGEWNVQSWSSHRTKYGAADGRIGGGHFERDQFIFEPWLDDPMSGYDCNPPLWQV